MPKGYWIAHIDVTDMEPYKGYIPLSTAAVAAFGGKMIIRGGRAEGKEGALRARHVVVEFPSYEQALACYHSPEYEQAQKVRAANALSDFTVVEGYDG